jgi:excisionase family DNA binding protein
MSKTRKPDGSSTPSTTTPEFYTRKEAAALLRMPLSTFDQRIKEGKIGHAKCGTAPRSPVLIPREAMYAALEARRRGEI